MTTPTPRDGGPAFPPNAGWRDDDPACRGMSRRDFFAAMAMAGDLATQSESSERGTGIVVDTCMDACASRWVALADALIAALDGTSSKEPRP